MSFTRQDDNMSEGGDNVVVGQERLQDEKCDGNDDDIDDEKYPSLDRSEPLGLWCVSSHRVEDVDQHQEKSHQQGHSTWNCQLNNC